MKSKIEWTPNLFEDFAAQGLSKSAAAEQLQVSPNTIFLKLRNPEFSEAWERGRAKLIAEGKGEFVGQKLVSTVEPPVKAELKQPKETLSSTSVTVLQAIKNGKHLRRQILIATGLHDALVLDALSDLVEDGQVVRREETTFTAFFTPEQNPSGKIYLSYSNGESVVVDSANFIPVPTPSVDETPINEEKKKQLRHCPKR